MLGSGEGARRLEEARVGGVVIVLAHVMLIVIVKGMLVELVDVLMELGVGHRARAVKWRGQRRAVIFALADEATPHWRLRLRVDRRERHGLELRDLIVILVHVAYLYEFVVRIMQARQLAHRTRLAIAKREVRGEEVAIGARAQQIVQRAELFVVLDVNLESAPCAVVAATWTTARTRARVHLVRVDWAHDVAEAAAGAAELGAPIQHQVAPTVLSVLWVLHGNILLRVAVLLRARR